MRTGILTVGGVPLAIDGEYLGAPDDIAGLRQPDVGPVFLHATGADYYAMFRWVWPRGWAHRGPNLASLLRSISDTFARLHAIIARFLVIEADPRTTESMLLDWERAYGLPDPCAADADLTLDQRRKILHAKVKMKGGQSIAYLEALAAGSGYPITIEEHEMMTCIDPCDGTLFAERWVHAFTVHAAETTIVDATCTDLCTVALRTWGNQRLECLISRARPAHSVAVFTYQQS